MHETSKRVYDAILDCWRMNYCPPTIREVMKVTAITTSSQVAYHYRRLAKVGLVTLRHGRPTPALVIDAIKGVTVNERQN